MLTNKDITVVESPKKVEKKEKVSWSDFMKEPKEQEVKAPLPQKVTWYHFVDQEYAREAKLTETLRTVTVMPPAPAPTPDIAQTGSGMVGCCFCLFSRKNLVSKEDVTKKFEIKK